MVPIYEALRFENKQLHGINFFFFRSSILTNEVFLLGDKDLLKRAYDHNGHKIFILGIKYHRYRNLTIRVVFLTLLRHPRGNLN